VSEEKDAIGGDEIHFLSPTLMHAKRTCFVQLIITRLHKLKSLCIYIYALKIMVVFHLLQGQDHSPFNPVHCYIIDNYNNHILYIVNKCVSISNAYFNSFTLFIFIIG